MISMSMYNKPRVFCATSLVGGGVSSRSYISSWPAIIGGSSLEMDAAPGSSFTLSGIEFAPFIGRSRAKRWEESHDTWNTSTVSHGGFACACTTPTCTVSIVCPGGTTASFRGLSTCVLPTPRILVSDGTFDGGPTGLSIGGRPVVFLSSRGTVSPSRLSSFRI